MRSRTGSHNTPPSLILIVVFKEPITKYFAFGANYTSIPHIFSMSKCLKLWFGKRLPCHVVMRVVCVTRWGLRASARGRVEYCRWGFRSPQETIVVVCQLVDRSELYHVYPSVFFDLRVRVSVGKSNQIRQLRD